MALIQPNLSDVQELAPIDEGVYPARILEVESKTSKTGNPMIVPTIEITVDGKPRKRQAFLVITGAGAFNFEQLLRATGYEDLADAYKDPTVEDPPFDTDWLQGKELQVIIKPDTYNGQITDKIAGFQRA